MAATYYYAVTGKVPPDAIERSAEDEIILPSNLNAVIPTGTEQTLMKGLSVSAPDRYQSMAEFYQALLGSMEKPFSEEMPVKPVRKKELPPSGWER